jgi:16S rRNA (adenine1518-N6/adenine1519-N6)-dimethyltransferase
VNCTRPRSAPPAAAEASVGPPPDVRRLLRKHGLKPDKSLGQNFLIEPAALRRVVEAADLTAADTVLEVGAGLGSLTYQLALTAGRVIAVEFDRRLIAALRESIASIPNVYIVNDDILSLDLSALVAGAEYRVVANIPYNITSMLIRRLIEASHPSQLLVLTVQREVAERIVAGPGDMSLLALSVQVYGRPSICGWIPADAFYPRPKVDSAVLRIDPASNPTVGRELIEPLFRLARAGFGQKRKKLVNALASGLDVGRDEVVAWLERADVPANVRAQELALESWGRLAAIAHNVPDAK